MTTFAITDVVKIIRSQSAPRNDQRPADEDRLRAVDQVNTLWAILGSNQ